jgi:hypothetical protein
MIGPPDWWQAANSIPEVSVPVLSHHGTETRGLATATTIFLAPYPLAVARQHISGPNAGRDAELDNLRVPTLQPHCSTSRAYSAICAQHTPATAWRNSPSVTAVASASRLTPGGSRRPPGTQARSHRAPAGATPAAGVTTSQRHARSPARPTQCRPPRAYLPRQRQPTWAASMELIWSADAVANAKRTWPRHNSTSADMHGTAIA